MSSSGNINKLTQKTDRHLIVETVECGLSFCSSSSIGEYVLLALFQRSFLFSFLFFFNSHQQSHACSLHNTNQNTQEVKNERFLKWTRQKSILFCLVDIKKRSFSTSCMFWFGFLNANSHLSFRFFVNSSILFSCWRQYCAKAQPNPVPPV